MVIDEMTPKEQIQTIATNIRARRKELGFTQGVVAKSVGVSAAYVSQIENLERVPDVELASEIAEALGTTLGALVTPGVFSKPVLTEFN